MRVVFIAHQCCLLAADNAARQVLVDVNALVHLHCVDVDMLFLYVAYAVGLCGETIVAETTDEWLVLTAAVGAQVVLERPEELEVLAAVLAHSVGRLEGLDV